jgi:regulator of protease activity HflC (stomatin/prohibitin superfamily)
MLMPLEVTSAYQLVGSDAAMVYEHLGTSYVEKILRPAIRASVRSATSHFTAQEAYSTRRDELQQRMQDQIGSEISQLLGNVAGFQGKGFSIISVMLRNVDLPKR